jgi:ribosomal protein S18 acetylase RimI-like enzyme
MTGRFHIKPTFFRDATRQDGAALTLIAQKTIGACYRSFLGVEKLVEFLESGAINEYVAQNLEKNYCPIQMLDREPIGFAICRDNIIDWFIVDYRYHQRGIGAQLLAHCESEMFQAYPEITVSCFEQYEPANRFFIKHGWTEVLTRSDKQLGVRTILYQKLWRSSKAIP